MMNFNAEIGLGSVRVETTINEGFSPEQITERCMEKLLSVAETAPEPIRDQAKLFQENMKNVVLFFMKEAIKSDRTNLYNAFTKNGFKDMAELLRKM